MQAGTNADGAGPNPRPLLSGSTILILSGYLLGVVSTRSGWEGMAWTAGLFGLAAWVGLTFDARRHRKNHAEFRRRHTAARLEMRIDRYLPGRSSLRRPSRRRRRVTTASYLPVTGAGGSRPALPGRR